MLSNCLKSVYIQVKTKLYFSTFNLLTHAYNNITETLHGKHYTTQSGYIYIHVLKIKPSTGDKCHLFSYLPKKQSCKICRIWRKKSKTNAKNRFKEDEHLQYVNMNS